MEQGQSLWHWGGGEDVIKGLAIEQPVVQMGLEVGNGGFEADVEVEPWS